MQIQQNISLRQLWDLYDLYALDRELSEGRTLTVPVSLNSTRTLKALESTTASHNLESSRTAVQPQTYAHCTATLPPPPPPAAAAAAVAAASVSRKLVARFSLTKTSVPRSP